MDFGTTADPKSSSAPKSTKSTTSTTAMLRIFLHKNAFFLSLRGSEAIHLKKWILALRLWIATPLLAQCLAMTEKWILGKQAKRSFFRKTSNATILHQPRKRQIEKPQTPKI
ncbi:hypothetical protein [Helicobacter canis]|uniref:hypothetical protein n=1 Tax=Helicobacter canis TaxID=29419 RepID=UPI0015F0A565|nr:hypothetical protein [Helicobacter canis]